VAQDSCTKGASSGSRSSPDAGTRIRYATSPVSIEGAGVPFIVSRAMLLMPSAAMMRSPLNQMLVSPLPATRTLPPSKSYSTTL